AGFVLAGMYLAVYSKDFFVVPLVLMFVLLRPSFRWELLWIGVVLGNIIYVVAAVFIGVAWWLLMRKLKRVLPEDHTEQTVMFWRLTALLLSYTLVQSLYAPDWGAYLRHITPLIPLFAL